MNYNQAIDLVDTFGPNKSKWPTKHRASLDQLSQTDANFKEYLADARRYDKMLNDWQQVDQDGVEIPDDDGPGEQEEEQEQEEAQGGMLEIDFNQIKDMDGMLAEAIVAFFENEDSDSYNVFTRDYDELTPIDVSDTQNLSLEALDDSVRRTTGPLQKTLRRLIAAQMQVRKQPGFRRGRLHAPSLHRLMTDDDKVFYKRSEAPAIDTAFTLLIDCSGSMHGHRMKLASETAYAIGTVLNKIGVEFECIGFTDNSSHDICYDSSYQNELNRAGMQGPIARHVPLSMPCFKSFSDRWNVNTQKRFAKVYNTQDGFSYGLTPEGCGIEFAARRLLKRHEQRKIMIVLTDGEAYVGHYNSVGTGERQHSREMVEKVSAAGVEMVGIGIAHAGVKRHYPNNMVIDDVTQMPAELIKILKELMLKKQ